MTQHPSLGLWQQLVCEDAIALGSSFSSSTSVSHCCAGWHVNSKFLPCNSIVLQLDSIIFKHARNAVS